MNTDNIDDLSQKLNAIEKHIAEQIVKEKEKMADEIGKIKSIGESTKQVYQFDHKVILFVGGISIILMIYFAINMFQMVSHVGKMAENTNIMTKQMVIIGNSIEHMNKNIDSMSKNTSVMSKDMDSFNKNMKDMTHSIKLMTKNVKSMDKGMKTMTTPSGMMNMWRR